ncbi:MAG: NADH-quinone oxidoreductase subunit C [Chloroflexota bacterium]
MTITFDPADPIETVGVELLHREVRGERETYVELRPEDLAPAVRALQADHGARLINVVGLDERALGRGFRAIFTLALANEKLVSLAACLASEEPSYPAVSFDVHAADWYERENFELLGICALGHPEIGNRILHNDWPRDLYPLRKDFPQDSPWPPRVGAMEPPPRATGPGVFQYTVGPVRSGVMESARFVISSLGEEIADVRTSFYWKHRGIEKLCEDRPLSTVTLFAERIAANSAIAHSLAFALAVEAMTNAGVSTRAQRTRVILAEMERLYNHMHDLASQADATGLTVGHAEGAILTEQLRRLNAEITGHRYLFGSIVPGGVKIDLTERNQRRIAEHMREFRHAFRVYIDALMTSTSHLDRLEQTGIVAPDVAHDHSLVGPVGRASGVDVDVRRDHPYAAYRGISFEVPVLARGDALARNQVRIAEVYQSISIIEQALADLPSGALRTPIEPLPPYAETQAYVEGPRGGIVHWLKANAQGELYRYRIRPASFVNWHVFHLATAAANILTDFPIIESSFALVLASNDR